MPLSNKFATLIAAKLHDPARYAQCFDSRFGPGSAHYLLQRATEVPLAAVGREFKRTKEWARQSYYMLGGKRGKLAAVRRPQEFVNLLRLDVTLKKILRLASGRRSKNEVASLLKCSPETLDHRLRGANDGMAPAPAAAQAAGCYHQSSAPRGTALLKRSADGQATKRFLYHHKTPRPPRENHSSQRLGRSQA